MKVKLLLGGLALAALLTGCESAPPQIAVAPAAGTFQGVFPCADCPGIDKTLVLKTDKTYQLKTVYQDKKETVMNEGSWRMAPGTRTLILTGTDEQYYVISPDRLELLQPDGQRVISQFDYTLQLKK